MKIRIEIERIHFNKNYKYTGSYVNREEMSKLSREDKLRVTEIFYMITNQPIPSLP